MMFSYFSTDVVPQTWLSRDFRMVAFPAQFKTSSATITKNPFPKVNGEWKKFYIHQFCCNGNYGKSAKINILIYFLLISEGIVIMIMWCN